MSRRVARIGLVFLAAVLTAPAAASSLTLAPRTVDAQAFNGSLHPDWSPDGKEIAYTTGLAVMAMSSADGAGRRTVATRKAVGSVSVYRQLVWASSHRIVVNFEGALVSFDPDTHAMQTLAPLIDDEKGGFVVSKDGSEVAYSERGGPRSPILSDRIAIAPVEGGSVQDVPTAKDADDRVFDLSPDGQQILFSRTIVKGFSQGRPSLLIEPVGGGKARSLGAAAVSARWSPDGRWIAYVVQRGSGSGPSEIMIVSASGGSARVLAPWTQAQPYAITWSADSKELAYKALDTVATVGLAGRPHFFKLGDVGVASEDMPQWSPDGKQIAFTGVPNAQSPGADKPSGVYVVDADGTGLRRLTP